MKNMNNNKVIPCNLIDFLDFQLFFLLSFPFLFWKTCATNSNSLFMTVFEKE